MSASGTANVSGFCVANKDRPPPAFPPQLKTPAAPNPERHCCECACAHHDTTEIVHSQAIRLPGSSPSLLIESHLPLCESCAAAARQSGWDALKRTWRKLLAIPSDVIEMLSEAAPGGLH